MTYAIEAEQLVKHYTGRGGDVEAVRGVDLHVREGEVFGFLGPNGAGKTTTISMICGLLRRDGGEVTVAGASLDRDPGRVKAAIGYVPRYSSTRSGGCS